MGNGVKNYLLNEVKNLLTDIHQRRKSSQIDPSLRNQDDSLVIVYHSTFRIIDFTTPDDNRQEIRILLIISIHALLLW
jgi:hypothetical protein